MPTETIEVTGHIVDSLLLAKILDTILEAGCDYEIADVSIGKTSLDPSSARIAVTGDDDVLGPLLDELQVHGANRTAQDDAAIVVADRDGVLPAGFYSTTNLAGDGAGGRPVDPDRQPRDGLRPRRARRPRRDRADAPRPGRRPGRGGQRRACGSQAPSTRA